MFEMFFKLFLLVGSCFVIVLGIGLIVVKVWGGITWLKDFITR